MQLHVYYADLGMGFKIQISVKDLLEKTQFVDLFCFANFDKQTHKRIQNHINKTPNLRACAPLRAAILDPPMDAFTQSLP